MVTFHLYPKVPRKAMDFSKVKEQTLPSQSLSLREIIRRFVRHESLPVHKEGFYEDRMGDLEKLSNADITVQMERAEELKEKISLAQARMKKKADDERQQAQTANDPRGVRNGPRETEQQPPGQRQGSEGASSEGPSAASPAEPARTPKF